MRSTAGGRQMPGEPAGRRPDAETRQPSRSLRPDHDQVIRGGLRLRQDLLGGMPAADVDLRLASGRCQTLGQVFERLLEQSRIMPWLEDSQHSELHVGYQAKRMKHGRSGGRGR